MIRASLAGLLASATVAATVFATMTLTTPGKSPVAASAPADAPGATARTHPVNRLATAGPARHAIPPRPDESSRRTVRPLDDGAPSPFVNAGEQFEPEAVPGVLRSTGRAGDATGAAQAEGAAQAGASEGTSDGPATSGAGSAGRTSGARTAPGPLASAAPVAPPAGAAPRPGTSPAAPATGGSAGSGPGGPGSASGSAPAPSPVASGSGPGPAPAAGGGFPAAPGSGAPIGGGAPSTAPPASAPAPAPNPPGAGPGGGSPAGPAAPQPIIVDNGPFKGFGPHTEPVIVVDGGILSPGASPGIMQLNDFELDGGVLEIEIWGPALGTDFDLLAISGIAKFVSGTIRFVFSDDEGGIYVPEVGDQFMFLAAAGGIQGFDGNDLLSLISVDLDASLAFSVLNNGSMLTLEILAAATPGSETADGSPTASVGAPATWMLLALVLVATWLAQHFPARPRRHRAGA